MPDKKKFRLLVRLVDKSAQEVKQDFNSRTAAEAFAKRLQNGESFENSLGQSVMLVPAGIVSVQILES